MLRARPLCWAALLGACCWAPLAVPADEPSPEPGKKKLSKEDVEKAEKAAKAHLEKLKGSHGKLTYIEDPALGRVLPGHAFFGVLFRQFPVGRVPPPGLGTSNVFVVNPAGKVEVLATPKQLENFYKDQLMPAKTEARMKDSARAYLRLLEEVRQDGFYKFKLDDDSTKVMENKAGGKVARAVATVMAGGSGKIDARLIFNRRGKLTGVSEDSKITPGPRPICQATKLLDADPVVRKMAEQDLLIMGRAAKGYLDEQRAKASPELRKAIDRLWKRILDEDR
jgi:hypothetical protein